MLLSEAEDAAGVWASHPSLKIRVTRVRRPWWLGEIGAGILLSAVGCDVDAGICLMVWLSAKFWVSKMTIRWCSKVRLCGIWSFLEVQAEIERVEEVSVGVQGIWRRCMVGLRVRMLMLP
ncbi:unnamed protein product [Rhodiola kirilowii]